MTETGDAAAKSNSRALRFTQLPVPPPETPDEIYCKEDFPDKSLFNMTIQHPAVSVPVKKTGSIRTILKRLLVKGVKNTHTDERSADRRIIVLKPGTTQSQIESAIVADENETDKDLLRWIPEFPVTRTYNDQSADELLRKLLPADYEIPSSFELVGPIAHVNLKQPCQPYKYWIGQILLERSSAVKIVVNKVGTIDTIYRTFEMEVLAGDADDERWSVVTVHEHGSSFQLDYRHVYWNSRLSGEHMRLVDLILKDQRVEPNRSLVVADLMAGVGPFAVPLTRPRAAKTNGDRHPPPVIVYANDLNPVSFQFLQSNAQTNKCRNLHCYNQDARAFVHWLQQQQQQQQQQQDNQIERIDHVIMNLPASAPEFLDAFRGWSLAISSLPTIHVHCFAPKQTKSEEQDAEHYYVQAVQRCERALGCPLEPGTARIHVVRNVSPSNNMLCISFPLPKAVTQLERIPLSSDCCNIDMPAQVGTGTPLGDEHAAKRAKLQ